MADPDSTAAVAGPFGGPADGLRSDLSPDIPEKPVEGPEQVDAADVEADVKADVKADVNLPSDRTDPTPAEAGLMTALSAVSAERNEYLQDLQRLQADFENYRRRVEAGREDETGRMRRDILTSILPLLDEVARLADAEPELAGAVARALDAHSVRLGLSRFGAAGETFDPAVHEALGVVDSADEDGLVATVLRPGWRQEDAILRPAAVVVVQNRSSDECLEEMQPDGMQPGEVRPGDIEPGGVEPGGGEPGEVTRA